MKFLLVGLFLIGSISSFAQASDGVIEAAAYRLKFEKLNSKLIKSVQKNSIFRSQKNRFFSRVTENLQLHVEFDRVKDLVASTNHDLSLMKFGKAKFINRTSEINTLWETSVFSKINGVELFVITTSCNYIPVVCRSGNCGYSDLYQVTTCKVDDVK
jgi:hypothetical protein